MPAVGSGLVSPHALCRSVLGGGSRAAVTEHRSCVQLSKVLEESHSSRVGFPDGRPRKQWVWLAVFNEIG